MLKRFMATALIATTLLQAGCGYFLYPERSGQKSGQVDPAILILDAGALFLGIIPGVVAFIVDITNGTIYLPAGEKSVIDKHGDRMSLQGYQAIPNAIPTGLSVEEMQLRALEIVVQPELRAQVEFQQYKTMAGSFTLNAG